MIIITFLILVVGTIRKGTLGITEMVDINLANLIIALNIMSLTTLHKFSVLGCIGSIIM